MKALLTTYALLELIVGAVLVPFPTLLSQTVLGAPLDSVTGVVVSRLVAVALIALGIACWGARAGGRSRAAVGVVIAALVFNGGVVAILAFAGLAEGIKGAGLWAAAAVHLVFVLWCIASLTAKASPQEFLMTE